MKIQFALGQAIKLYRSQSGVSQEKFALSIGMDRTYLASVEAGKRNISVANIEKIASGLNLQISDLFLKAESLSEHKGDDAV